MQAPVSIIPSTVLERWKIELSGFFLAFRGDMYKCIDAFRASIHGACDELYISFALNPGTETVGPTGGRCYAPRARCRCNRAHARLLSAIRFVSRQAPSARAGACGGGAVP